VANININNSKERTEGKNCVGLMANLLGDKLLLNFGAKFQR